VKGIVQKRLASVSLVLATFFNPFGFDILFALILKWTKSYWATVLVFYALSAFFFGLYFFFSYREKLLKKQE
jgi:hypothetical protein